jgi:hypothetical protein
VGSSELGGWVIRLSKARERSSTSLPDCAEWNFVNLLFEVLSWPKRNLHAPSRT